MNLRISFRRIVSSVFPLFFICSLFLSGESSAQELWVTDAPVYSLARSGNTLYAGGIFERVGPATGTLAVSDLATGTVQSGWPRVTGTIYSIVSDGSGGWYIGGSITQVGSSVRQNIAHILADKTVDPDFAPDSDGPIYAMARSGNVLYVGGSFTYIGSAERDYIAGIDTTTGEATSFNPGATNTVRALVFNNTLSTLYIGGDFSGAASFGGQNRNRLAAVDFPAGTVNAWNPGASGIVYSLAVYPPPDAPTSSIIVGGSFSGVNSLAGAARDFLGAVTAASPGVIVPWNPDPDGTVRAISGVNYGGVTGVYIGGDFTHVGVTARDYSALISTAGALLAWNPGPDAAVYSIHVAGGNAYIGGSFSSVSGGASQKGIAGYDITSGALSAFNPSIGDTVWAIASDATSLAFGGEFVSTGMISRKSFAAFDLTTGEATSLDVPVVGVVTSILPIGDRIYIGGGFATVGGAARASLAAIDSSGTVLDFNGNVTGVVNSLKASGNSIYVCGIFTQVLAQARNNFASIDASTAALTSWNPDADGGCKSIEVDSNGIVYAGGSFTTFAGPVTRRGLASFDTSGSVTSWDPAPNGSVDSLLADGDYLYAGGAFTAIGGKPKRFLSQFNRSDGSLTGWNPQPSGPITSLAVFNGKIIAGGYIVVIGQAFRYGVAALDPVTALADEWNPMLITPMVLALHGSSDRLVVGGMFQSSNLFPLAHIANVTPLVSTVIPAAPGGTARDGETLTVVNDGTWAGVGTVTTTRQWQRCTANGLGCFDIAGQTGTTYVPGASDVGGTVRIYVTADDSLMSAGAGGTTSAIIAPRNSKLPKIKGKALVGRILSASSGSWNGVGELTISYAWQRCGKTCKAIPKAKLNKYKVSSKDVGKKLQVVVSASKNGSNKTAATSKKTKKVRW